MLRGTRVIKFENADIFVDTINTLRNLCRSEGYKEVIFPSIWNTSTFTEKLGAEKEAQMWTFLDKGDRECCLIPEVTGIVQELWREEWSKQYKSPLPIFYVQRCYRYERPQAGRYREFTQFGVEILGDNSDAATASVKDFLRKCLESLSIDFSFKDSVSRGLSYYVGNGFEVEVEKLGAQKQIAGGGSYKEGVGFAIGIDRLIMSMS